MNYKISVSDDIDFVNEIHQKLKENDSYCP